MKRWDNLYDILIGNVNIGFFVEPKMEPSNGMQSEVKKPLSIRILKWSLIVLAIAVLAVLLIVPAYLSSDAGKKLVVSKLNDSLDGRIEVSDLSMGWLKGVRVEDLSFKDTAGLISVKIKNLKTKPSYLALLSGNLVLSNTEISKPDITMKFERGKESGILYASANEISSKNVKASDAGLTSIKLDIKGGNVAIAPQDNSQQAVVLKFQNIESKVDLKPAGKRSSFDVKMDIADGARSSKISAKGNLKTGKEKSWTLKGTSGEFVIKIDNLDLKSLSPLFALMDVEVDASGKLNADITANINDGVFEKLDAKAVLEGLEKSFDGKATVLDEPIKVEAKVSAKGKKIKIDKLDISSSFCQMTCSGGTDTVDYTITADLEGTQNFAKQFVDLGGYKLKGNVVEKGTMSFRKGGMSAKGLATIEGLEVSKEGVRDIYRDNLNWPFDVVIDTEKQVFQIASMSIAGSFGKLNFLRSSIPLGKTSKEKMSLDVKADIDLGKAKSIIALTEAMQDDMELGGRVKSKLSVNSGREGYHIVTNGATIENLRLGKAGQEPFTEKLMTVTVDMMCDPEDKSISIDELVVESSQINITKGKIKKSSKNGKTTLKGKLVAKYDLSGVSKAASAFLPEGLMMEGIRTDTLTLESVYRQDDPDGMMSNMNADMQFGFDKAEYMGLNIGAVDIDVNVKGGLLTISPFTAKVNDGTMNFAASVDFNQKPSLLKIPMPIQIADKININDKTTDKLLKYVNPIFANSVNVRGVADFHCEQLNIPLAGASKNDMTVIGTIAMNDVHLNASNLLGQIISMTGEKDPVLTMLPTRFILQNGYLSYENMQINIGERPVNFRGRIGLNKTIAMDIELPFTYSGKKTSDASASNRVTIPIEGDLDKPGINTGKLLEKGLEGEIDKVIKEKLGPEGGRILRDILKGL